MRSIFFGTPEIAVPALRALADTTELRAVVCQPDRPAGRGLAVHAPAIKTVALELGVELRQPTKIRTPDFAAWVRSLDADLALVMAYGRILPPAVLAATRLGFLNLHASLLPRYRGAAPIQWAIVRGETETGISLMQMDEGCDTGPVYTMRRIPIGAEVTADELGAELAALAATVVRDDLPAVWRGELAAVPQQEVDATLAPLIEKADGQVDFARSAREVHNRVRGMTPWPGACAWLHDKRFKITRTALASERGEPGPAGTVLRVSSAGAEVACGRGTVLVLRGQLEGKRECDALALSHGRCLAVGSRFGAPPTPPSG